MSEKLNWAARSCSRMHEAKKAKDAESVQDHFWAFLHASRLIWFYLGEFFQRRGDPKGMAGQVMNQWVASNLSTSEQKVWKAVAEMRTEDVHTQPVEAEERQSHAIAVRGGKILVRDRKICCVKLVTFMVRSDGVEYDAHTLADEGVQLLRRFVHDFPTLI